MSFDTIAGSVIASLLSAIIITLVAYSWGRYKKPPPLPSPVASPPAPPSPLVPDGVRLPPNQIPKGTRNPRDHDAEGYPTFLRVSELPPPPPDVLPYDTPILMTRELAALHALSRRGHAENRFVGRSVAWTGTIWQIEEADECLNVRATSSFNMPEGHVTLVFPLRRQAEVEVLNEGQKITYKGQIRRASENGVELVRVAIVAPSDLREPRPA